MTSERPAGVDAIDKRYRIAAAIVFSQIIVSLILTAAAWFAAREREPSGAATDLAAPWVLMIFVAAGALVLRRFFFSWERLRNVKLLKGGEGLIRTLQVNAVALGAVSEAIAILGFVIAMMSGSFYDMVRGEAVALITFLINFPRKAVWHRVAESLSDV